MANEQYGFYVDTTRCIECWGCVIACKQWHGIFAGTVSRRNIDQIDEGAFPDFRRSFLSLSCRHCETPACAAFCSENAIEKRGEDGIVFIDWDTCTACGNCLTACPYGVPQLRYVESFEDYKADKCDACLSLERPLGEDPHCVATCPMGALHFGTMNEMEALAGHKSGKRLEGTTEPSVFVS